MQPSINQSIKNRWVLILCHCKFHKHTFTILQAFDIRSVFCPRLGSAPSSTRLSRNYKHFPCFTDIFSGYCLWSPRCWTFLLFHRENRGHQKWLLQPSLLTHLTLISLLIHLFLSVFREMVLFFLFEEIAKFMFMLNLISLTHLHLLITWSLKLSAVSMTAITHFYSSLPNYTILVPSSWCPSIILPSNVDVLWASYLNSCLHPGPFS